MIHDLTTLFNATVFQRKHSLLVPRYLLNQSTTKFQDIFVEKECNIKSTLNLLLYICPFSSLRHITYDSESEIRNHFIHSRSLKKQQKKPHKIAWRGSCFNAVVRTSGRIFTLYSLTGNEVQKRTKDTCQIGVITVPYRILGTWGWERRINEKFTIKHLEYDTFLRLIF